MNLKETILYNAGIEQQLNEGIRFFKNSKRLNKLVSRLERKTKKVESKDLEKVIEELNVIAQKFDFLEKKFARASIKEEKSKIKEEYKDLERKNLEVIKLINKESTKKVLFTIGAVGLIIGILTLLSIGSYNSALSSSLMDQARSETRNIGRLKRNVGSASAAISQNQEMANALSVEQAKAFGLGGVRNVNLDGRIMKVDDAVQYVNGEIANQQEIFSDLMKQVGTAEASLANTQQLAYKAKDTATAAKAGSGVSAGVFGVLTTSKLFSKIGKNNRVAKEAEKAIKDIKNYDRKD